MGKRTRRRNQARPADMDTPSSGCPIVHRDFINQGSVELLISEILGRERDFSRGNHDTALQIDGRGRKIEYTSRRHRERHPLGHLDVPVMIPDLQRSESTLREDGGINQDFSRRSAAIRL